MPEASWSKEKRREASGRPLFLLGVGFDITEQTKATELLERLNDKLEITVPSLQLANNELKASSYSVSHDLRAPLRAIDGFSRILLEDFLVDLPDDAQQLLRDVRAGTQQMGQLIDDLLAFSRLNRQSMNPETIDPTRLIQTCWQSLHAETEGRAIDFRIGELTPCRADPVLLKQVWMNLLDNAVKYTCNRATAVISCKQRRDSAGRR